jgi:hypothetical protein
MLASFLLGVFKMEVFLQLGVSLQMSCEEMFLGVCGRHSQQESGLCTTLLGSEAVCFVLLEVSTHLSGKDKSHWKGRVHFDICPGA